MNRTEAEINWSLEFQTIKGSLHKKKPEIYWSFANKGGGVPPDQYISVFFLKKTFIASK